MSVAPVKVQVKASDADGKEELKERISDITPVLKEDKEMARKNASQLTVEKTKKNDSAKSDLKITPTQNTFDDTLNLAFANGSYTPPSKMWYYNKQLSDVTTISTAIYDYTKGLVVNFKLPQQMKELVFTFVIPGINTVANAATSNLPGFEIALYYDNTFLNSSLHTFSEAAGRSITRTVVLEGTIYNASSGIHTATVQIRSTNGNIVNFYLQEQIPKENMKININMVGYCGTPQQYSK